MVRSENIAVGISVSALLLFQVMLFKVFFSIITGEAETQPCPGKVTVVLAVNLLELLVARGITN